MQTNNCVKKNTVVDDFYMHMTAMSSKILLKQDKIMIMCNMVIINLYINLLFNFVPSILGFIILFASTIIVYCAIEYLIVINQKYVYNTCKELYNYTQTYIYQNYVAKFNKMLFETNNNKRNFVNKKRYIPTITDAIKNHEKKNVETLSERMELYEKYNKTSRYLKQHDSYIVKIKCSIFDKIYKIIGNKEDKINWLKTENNITWLKIKIALNKKLLLSSKALLKTFSPSTIFVQNNHIYLVFSNYNNSSQLYDGNITRILTSIVSVAGAKFCRNDIIMDEIETQFTPEIYDVLINELSKTIFNADLIIFNENNAYDICNYILWKSQYESVINFVSTFSKNLLLLNNNTEPTQLQQRIELITHKLNEIKETNNFTDIDLITLQKGVFMKKHTIDNTITNRNEHRILTFLLPEIKCDDCYIDLILNKNSDNNNYQKSLIIDTI